MFLAVFAASLLGSLHCAGMCGAFITIAVGLPSGEANGWRRAAAIQSAYHVGRLISYTLLGAAAGAAGSLLNLGGALAGIRTLALAFSGAAIATFGTVSLLRASGVNIGRLHLPPAWTRRVSRLSATAMSRPPIVRAGVIGLLTTLLPCGWLYAFAVTAAGTGNALTGAATMAAFWAGTLPALAAVGVGARKLAGPLAKRLPVVTAIVMVVVGGWMFLGRSGLDAVALARTAQARTTAAETPACCVDHQP
jgi:sulfite exporter TauE/SafE